MKVNMERMTVIHAWIDEHKCIEILNDTDGKFVMKSFIKEKENRIRYLEKKYPFLNDVKKVMFSKRKLKLNKWEL